MSKIKYGLTPAKVDLALIAWAEADELDKSTAWMLQFMQDTARISLDAVLYILRETPDDLTNDEARAWWAKRFQHPKS